MQPPERPERRHPRWDQPEISLKYGGIIAKMAAVGIENLHSSTSCSSAQFHSDRPRIDRLGYSGTDLNCLQSRRVDWEQALLDVLQIFGARGTKNPAKQRQIRDFCSLQNNRTGCEGRPGPKKGSRQKMKHLSRNERRAGC
jgi:hypothetical protein